MKSGTLGRTSKNTPCRLQQQKSSSTCVSHAGACSRCEAGTEEKKNEAAQKGESEDLLYRTLEVKQGGGKERGKRSQ